ncbi:hypothetical protein ARMSODRAFT_722223 [Armillaria solidipes]|uniref:Uncharacterized protein n=1 Tax=Armillaria solidipes TaxID=1076256 RepID=A0A2H3BC42_9AGAR|nr:hypothetical protein ARMSODRAFT_722223 [Armillaria solidipes]
MAALDYLGPALANDLISHPINCLRDDLLYSLILPKKCPNSSGSRVCLPCTCSEHLVRLLGHGFSDFGILSSVYSTSLIVCLVAFVRDGSWRVYVDVIHFTISVISARTSFQSDTHVRRSVSHLR